MITEFLNLSQFISPFFFSNLTNVTAKPRVSEEKISLRTEIYMYTPATFKFFSVKISRRSQKNETKVESITIWPQFTQYDTQTYTRTDELEDNTC